MRKELSGKKPNTWTPLKIISRNYKTMVFLLMTAFCLSFSMVNMGHAASFGDSSSGFYGGIDVTLSYATMFRVEGRDSRSISTRIQNRDDGNHNFDYGLISNQLKAVAQFEIQKDFPWANGSLLGFFTSGFAFWDTEMANASNDNNSPGTHNSGPVYNGPLSKNNTFTDPLENLIGRDADILDAVLYGEFFRGSNPLSIKIGRHAVNWGETGLIKTGLSFATTPFDLSKSTLPGTEVREIILPINQASVNYQATTNLAIGGYYQFEWQEHVLWPSGSFFSPLDQAGDGATNVLIPVAAWGLTPGVHTDLPFVAIDRTRDMDADDSGQFGLSLTWLAEFLNSPEFTLYYANYHSKLPSIVIISDGTGTVDNNLTGVPPPPGPPGHLIMPLVDTARYSIKYWEDVKLYALGWNSSLPIFDTVFSGEVVYHDDIPLQTMSLPHAVGAAVMPEVMGAPPGTIVYASSREELITAQASFIPTLNFPSIADDFMFWLEVGMMYTPDLDDGEAYSNSDYLADQFSWGYKCALKLTYFDLIGRMIEPLSGTDLIATLNFSHDVKGNAPLIGGYFQDNKSAGCKFEARWRSAISLVIGYNMFWGNTRNNVLVDKDNVTFSLKWRL